MLEHASLACTHACIRLTHACSLGLLAQLHTSQRMLHSGLEAEVAHRVEHGLSATELGADCYGCVASDPLLGTYCDQICLSPCELDILAHHQLREESAHEPFGHEVASRRAFLLKQETWICRYNSLGMVATPEHHGDVWIAAMYVALVQLSGGVGSIVPENRPEYIVFFIGILIGSVIWAMVVGTICAMMATGDPHTTAYKHSMDALNDFLRDTQMPQEIGVAARAYLRNTRELAKKFAYDELMSKFSPGLRGSIMLYLSSSTFNSVWYLAPCEPDCLVALAAKLRRSGFPPREKMAATRLSICMRGIAARGGDLLYGGGCWGEDIILSAAVLRDTRFATALTYVEVVTLERPTLFEVLAEWPRSKRIVQDAAVRMALKRTVVLLKAYGDAQRRGDAAAAKGGGGGGGGGGIGDGGDGGGGGNGIGGGGDADGAATPTGTPSAKSPGGGGGVSSSDAYSMLTAAFTPSEACDGAQDLGKIFRTITGARLRDVDAEGNLVEQVVAGEAPVPAPAATSVHGGSSFVTRRESALQGEKAAAESAKLQRSVDAVRQDVAALKGSIETIGEALQKLLPPSAT